MYSTKTATTNNQEFNSSYMPVGINENITLKEVNVNKTQNGRDDAQFGRLLQIIYCYYPSEQVNFEGSSFIEMINWVKMTLDAVEKKSEYPVRLKVVYDKNGYTKVSNLGVFVESMSVAKEESQIKLWKNDLLERPVKADEEKPNDPLGTTTAPVTADSTGADNLPF